MVPSGSSGFAASQEPGGSPPAVERSSVGFAYRPTLRHMASPTIAALRLPIPWEEFDLPNPLMTRSTVLLSGDPAWHWSGATPEFPIPSCAPQAGEICDGWDLDHIVLLVPDLEAAIETLGAVELSPRLRMEVRGRPTAFFRVGPLLEVIQSPVRKPVLYGVALVTDAPLEVIVLHWRSMGRDVTDPKPAIQPGRRIFTVRGTEAGFAVMSPDKAVPTP